MTKGLLGEKVWECLVFAELDRVDTSFFGENLCVDYIVHQSLLFEELLVIQKVRRWKNPFEEPSPFILIISVLDSLTIFLTHIVLYLDPMGLTPG